MARSWNWTLSKAGSSTRVTPPMNGDQKTLVAQPRVTAGHRLYSSGYGYKQGHP